MNILNIEHVSKVFGEKVVLDDVSYGVHQGDKIGIIGINAVSYTHLDVYKRQRYSGRSGICNV